jgi:acyl-CoA thioesterase-1
MRGRWMPGLLLGGLAALAACSDASSSSMPGSQTSPPPDTAETTAADPLVVCLGDSLTAGYGLAADQAWPALVESTLRAEGRRLRVLNAGVSGDTTAGGLSRLRWLLKQDPDLLVVALGGNDGLRGLPVESTRANLAGIIDGAREAGVEVLLLGMRMPPNLGPDYTRDFERVYTELADELDVRLVPFLLEGVAGRADLNQPDGIHPTAEGQRILAKNVLPALRELLDG